MSGKLDKIMLPVIKNLPPMPLMKDIMGVQPMGYKGPPPYTEYVDVSNPRVGVVINDGDKHPGHGGCCREMWSKIWTPRRGWVREKEDLKGFKRMYRKYTAKYKATIETERKAWNRKHGITNQCFFNMTIVYDSKQQQ